MGMLKIPQGLRWGKAARALSTVLGVAIVDRPIVRSSTIEKGPNRAAPIAVKELGPGRDQGRTRDSGSANLS